ncbi:hypothetical protein L3V32_10220 [Vibrio sp. J2-4]|uniref:hypothetical protein n=1 Tax=Vibrio sp. J2-4 TaxID=1507977 RepID=UPI001F316358|nr:hypothetical protein [Vibrio sp. J2-4]MCF7477069.1 hypothetical protein [Vibrio sp. J2-4]
MKITLNKAFKSDSQRLAVSLRSSIAKRRSHLNAALCDKAKFWGFFKFNLFGNSLFGFGKSAFSAQILESLKQ